MLGAVLHYMSGIDDWSPSRYDLDTGQQRTIDAFITVDAQYTYTLDDVIGDSTQLRVGVYNLLDQAPPFADVLDSYVAALHDPRGRMVYASVAQGF
jgi:outer membrane receptor protein involved in Fe transport